MRVGRLRAARVGEGQRLEWPVTCPRASPPVTRPGRLLLRFCDWVGSDFAAADLRRLLQSGDCAPAAFDATTQRPGFGGDRFRIGDGALTPGQAARLLLKAQATWGRDTYAPALATLAVRYRRAPSSAKRARRTGSGTPARPRRRARWARG